MSHYSDLEILEACGKLDTNSFELKLKGPEDGEVKNLRAMYRLASILSHDCRPNTKHTFDPDYAVNVYATSTIRKFVPVGHTPSVLKPRLGVPWSWCPLVPSGASWST